MQAKLGQWVRVKYSDTGVNDGIVVGVRHPVDESDYDRRYDVYSVGNQSVDHYVEEEQIIAVGNHLTAVDSGL